MAIFLDSVNCPDNYDGKTGELGPLFRSNGGYFAVSGHDVYCQLGWTPDGVQDVVWTAEAHIPIGATATGATGVLYPGTSAIRFRNYTAGQVAVVSAGLYSHSEPALAISTGGVSAPAVSTRSGHVTGVTWPGGTATSNAVTVTHGVGGVPSAVLITTDLFNTANTGTLALVAGVGAVDSTTFKVSLVTGDGSFPGGTAVSAFYWVAVA